MRRSIVVLGLLAAILFIIGLFSFSFLSDSNAIKSKLPDCHLDLLSCDMNHVTLGLSNVVGSEEVYVIFGYEETIPGFEGLVPGMLFYFDQNLAESLIFDIDFTFANELAKTRIEIYRSEFEKRIVGGVILDGFETTHYANSINRNMCSSLSFSNGDKSILIEHVNREPHSAYYRIIAARSLEELKENIEISSLVENWNWEATEVQ